MNKTVTEKVIISPITEAAGWAQRRAIWPVKYPLNELQRFVLAYKPDQHLPPSLSLTQTHPST